MQIGVLFPQNEIGADPERQRSTAPAFDRAPDTQLPLVTGA
jgi:hypothetical protein